MSKGWIEFSVEALHEISTIIFDILEENFTILEVDHSTYESNNSVRLLLEDSSSSWFVPTVDGSVHEYVMILETHYNETWTEEEIKFRIELIN